MSGSVCTILMRWELKRKNSLLFFELKELECNLFFIIIIDMKKNSWIWGLAESNAVFLNTEQKRGNVMQKQGNEM